MGMSHYIHHVPGRLRVKSPRLKRNQSEAQQTQGYLDQVDGVLSTEVNTVTGSLLIKYDANRIAAQTLLDSLRALGHLHPQQGHDGVYAGPGVGQQLSDKVMNKLLETVIERSATALIAAII